MSAQIYVLAADLEKESSISRLLNILRLVAISLSAIALVPAGAHVFELPNKMGLAQGEYFTVQGIYRGWALFGFVLFGNALSLMALLAVQWTRGLPTRSVLLSFLCQLASLAIFFALVFPANIATNNWTAVSEQWETLRWRWEVGHALSAAFAFIAFESLVIGMIFERSSSRREGHPVRQSSSEAGL